MKGIVQRVKDKFRPWVVYKCLAALKCRVVSSVRLAAGDQVRIVTGHYGDKRLGVATGDSCALEDDHSLYKDGCRYEATPYGVLARVIEYLDLKPHDVFIDLGCGKGRAVFLAAEYRIRKAIGVELSEEMVDVARENLDSLRSNSSPIEFINADAATFDPKDGTVFFMFNPFGQKTFSQAIENIKASLAANPRQVRIVYYSPRFKELLDAQDWLEPEGEIGGTGVLVWRST